MSISLINIAQNCKIFKIVRFVYLILANISDDDTVQGLPETNLVIKSLASDMNAFCNYFKSTKTVNRIYIEIMDIKKGIKEYDISFLNGKSLIGVLYGLNKLASDPILKYKIWKANYCQSSLKYIIMNGNEIEKLYALRLFHNLCLIEQVIDCVYFDEALKYSIENLSSNKKIQIEEIKILSKKIVRLMEDNLDLPIRRALIYFAYGIGFVLKRFVYTIEESY